MHQGRPNDGSSPSYLSCRPEYLSLKQNPIEDAVSVIKKLGGAIDWLVCPGDLADKCDIVAQSAAWAQLEQLKRRLHARRLIGTVGNHDVDSRRADPARLPDEALRNLNPPSGK
jgi:metallophosphoesterase superfamily enzyme